MAQMIFNPVIFIRNLLWRYWLREWWKAFGILSGRKFISNELVIGVEHEGGYFAHKLLNAKIVSWAKAPYGIFGKVTYARFFMDSLGKVLAQPTCCARTKVGQRGSAHSVRCPNVSALDLQLQSSWWIPPSIMVWILWFLSSASSNESRSPHGLRAFVFLITGAETFPHRDLQISRIDCRS